MSKDLTTYLNDHLAGSVGALELLDHLIKTYKGKPLEQFFKDLRNEIDADQGTLQDLIEKLGEKESAVRKAALWMAEKLARAKIRLSDSEEGRMGLLHALEGLVLGITGKRGLWTALLPLPIPCRNFANWITRGWKSEQRNNATASRRNARDRARDL